VGARTYAANLQNVGLVMAESQTLLSAYLQVGDWAKVRQLALEQNLLGKRSTTTVRHILKVVARRYLKGPDWLPPARSAGQFFAQPAVPARAKAQAAFLYTVTEDLLVQVCLESLVLPRPRPLSGSYLHLDEVLSFLRSLEPDHPEVGRWRPYLRRRWSSGFLTLLRAVGFMQPAPSWRLTSPVIFPEAFGFVFPWLVEQTGSARAAMAHKGLGWWALDAVEQSELLARGQDRGWWRYATAGSLLEFEPLHPSTEVLTHALG